MKIRLLCIKGIAVDTNMHGDDDPKEIYYSEGTEYNAIIDMPYNGIRLEVPGKKNHYTFPYHIDDIKKYFISAFDKERYDEIYTKVKNCKIYIDSKCLDVGEAIIKQE